MSGSALVTEVPATLRPGEAADVKWNTVVIGGGPAGAAVAIRLARNGRRVVVIDRQGMPRPKVCGCCLSSRAGAELRGLGWSADACGRLQAAAPLERVRVVAAGRSATLPFPGGGVVSREMLDAGLIRMAIDAGAAWLPGGRVTGVEEVFTGDSGVVIACDLRSGRRVWLRAETAVIATGLADHVRVRASPPRHVRPGSRIGVGTTLAADLIDLPPGELVMAVARGGYCGLVRLEDGRIDVAAAVDRRQIAACGTIGPAVAGVLGDAAGPAGWLAAVRRSLLDAPMRATPQLTRSAGTSAGVSGRILRVGDAAGYVEPFTGEGMGWALTSGRLAAEALLTATAPAKAYGRSFGAFAARHHRRCHRVAAVVRHPRLVGAAMRVADAAPGFAAALLPWLVGATAVRGDSSP
ncbi:MAG: hypothetical protein RLZZ440_361 [Planctomycetota bacterium]